MRSTLGPFRFLTPAPFCVQTCFGSAFPTDACDLGHNRRERFIQTRTRSDASEETINHG
jgi:hypothetical protein